jgi:flagellar hook-basal body complex protein FliE
MEDYKQYRDRKDKEFNEKLKAISDKIDDIQKSADEKFEALIQRIQKLIIKLDDDE